MPTVPKGEKILVTGATGYVAVWVIRILLERGYAVRGTVRSQGKGAYLLKLFESYGKSFELVVVHDIAEDGAFDEAVKGVDAIAHTASPFYPESGDPKVIIEPAVKGTTGILNSVLQHGPGIKRIIVLSSTAAIAGFDGNKICTEDDWYDDSIAAVNALGSEAHGIVKYMASKNLAEKAAWKLYEENKKSISWDLTVINPPYVFGPILHEVHSVEALNTSSADWYKSILAPSALSDETLAKQGASYIDVRDLAEAHVLSFEKKEAGGERIIVCARSFIWQDFYDAAHSLSPEPIPGRKIAKGVPGSSNATKYPLTFDTTKSERILGLRCRSIEDTTRDTLSDFQRRGW